MKIGFTGTQIGMTAIQCGLFLSRSRELQPTEFHHGDCIGADYNAHNIIRYHFPLCRVVIHPPIIERKRTFCSADFMHEPLDYLVRNKNIVNATDILIAAPKSHVESLRSGTWSTVRYANKIGKKVILIFP